MLQDRYNPEPSHYLGKGQVFVVFPVKGETLSRERGRELVVNNNNNDNNNNNNNNKYKYNKTLQELSGILE